MNYEIRTYLCENEVKLLKERLVGMGINVNYDAHSFSKRQGKYMIYDLMIFKK